MRSTCIALCTIQAVTENALDAKWWLPMKRKNIEDTFYQSNCRCYGAKQNPKIVFFRTTAISMSHLLHLLPTARINALFHFVQKLRSFGICCSVLLLFLQWPCQPFTTCQRHDWPNIKMFTFYQAYAFSKMMIKNLHFDENLDIIFMPRQPWSMLVGY